MSWRRAFSTLGCAGAPLAHVLALARLGGCEGLELRAAPGEPVHVGLSAGAREDARAAISAAGVRGVFVHSDENDRGAWLCYGSCYRVADSSFSSAIRRLSASILHPSNAIGEIVP